jgi:chemotaxis protein histidine kinase CheA
MERRYLAATLTLVATFAIFSREFRSGHLATLPCSRAEMRAEIACAKRYATEQLVAKVRPFVDRGVPEEQQMVAELNLPVLAAVNEKVAEAQAAAAQKITEKNCEAAVRAQDNARRAQEATQRAHEMSTHAAERAQEISARANERAQEISARAAEQAHELSLRANQRAIEINARAIERAQRISACAMERAQRALEKSRTRMSQPKVESLPIPINFEVVSPSDLGLPVQE